MHEASCPAPSGPRAPSNPEVEKVATKLAEFVARNGRQFEEVTRQRNPGDTPFRFVVCHFAPCYRRQMFHTASSMRVVFMQLPV